MKIVVRPNVCLALVLAVVLGIAGSATPAAAQVYCAPPAPVPPGPPQDDPHPHCETCEQYCQGSPCYVGSGVYVTEATDLAIRTLGRGLQVGRKYESHRNVDGPLGVGWMSTLTPRLYQTVYYKSAPSTYLEQVHVRLPDGFGLSFTKQSGGAYTSADGRRDTLVKEADGRWTLTLQDDVTVLRFNADGSLDTLNGDYGTGLKYEYDPSGRVVRVSDLVPSGRAVTVQWGADGRIETVTDHTGRVVRYSYDATSGTLTSVDDALTSTIANEEAVHYTYVAGRFGPVLSKVEDRWFRTISELEWYPSGQLLSYTDGEFDPANPGSSPGEKYTYTYYPNGTQQRPEPFTQKVSSRGYGEIFPYGATGLRRDNMTFDDATGRVLSVTDDFGTSEFTYDTMGRILTTRRYKQNGDSVTWTYTYDATYPRKIASIVSNFPKLWSGRRFTYYDASSAAPGALHEISNVYTDAAGVETVVLRETLEYNARGQTTKRTSRGNVTSYVYNSSGDLTSVTDAGRTTSYEYDTLGRVTTTTDAAARETTYTYDAGDRIVSLTLPKPAATSPLNFVTTYAYDVWDAATGLASTEITDANGRTSRYGYDVLSHLVKATDTMGNVTAYGHVNNLLRTITDANGNVTRYTYDLAGQLQSTAYPDGYSESYERTIEGTLLARTDRRGIRTQYGYDFIGRLVSKSYPSDSVIYEFNGELLKRVTDSRPDQGGATDFTYDSTFRLASEQPSGGYKISYDYLPYTDLVERYTVTPPTGSTDTAYSVSYGYDARQNLISMGWTRSSGYFRFTYEPDGAYSTITLPNGQERRYTYDGQGRLTRMATTRPNVENPFASFVYGYDTNWSATTPGTMLGQRTSVDVITDLQAPEEGRTKYSYDANYQLIGVTTPTRTSTWTYDPIGNRTSADGVGYTYYKYAGNSKNSSRLRSSPFGTYTYDANGNLSGKGTLVFGWDQENRLISYGTASATYASFMYDHVNRRIASSVGQTQYIVRGFDTVGERSPSTGVANDYLFAPGIDQPLARRDASGAITYFMVDGLGSVVGLANTAGLEVSSADYTAWGESGSVPSLFGYTAREVAGIESYYYYRARYYDPRVARFLSEDPIREYLPYITARALYAYVNNQPLVHVDPTGLTCVTTWNFGPKIKIGENWSEDWVLKTSYNPTPQAGANNAPSPQGQLVPANQSPAGGVPYNLQVCYWEKMLKVTTHFTQQITIMRTCQCPDSSEVLASWADTTSDVWYLHLHQYFKTVGIWVPLLPPKPCPNPAALGM